jgi:hypothetical protein
VRSSSSRLSSSVPGHRASGGRRSFSHDAGATFGAPVRLDEAGTLGHVGVALLSDGTAVASWVEFANRRAQFEIRRLDPAGSCGPAQVVSGIGAERTSGYPRIVRRADELLLAWTETHDGGSTVKTAVARW